MGNGALAQSRNESPDWQSAIVNGRRQADVQALSAASTR
jgi:hypothetical protein